jgi:hypothetical protein
VEAGHTAAAAASSSSSSSSSSPPVAGVLAEAAPASSAQPPSSAADDDVAPAVPAAVTDDAAEDGDDGAFVFDVDAELDALRAQLAEHAALQPRAAALRERLVAASDGWPVEWLEHARHVVVRRAEEYRRRSARRGGGSAAAATATAPSRSALLHAVEADVERVIRELGGGDGGV